MRPSLDEERRAVLGPAIDKGAPTMYTRHIRIRPVVMPPIRVHAGRGRATLAWVLTAAATLLFASSATAQPFGPWEPATSIDSGGLHGVNTSALEGCPIESPDGQTLFFATNREAAEHGIDIWVAERQHVNVDCCSSAREAARAAMAPTYTKRAFTPSQADSIPRISAVRSTAPATNSRRRSSRPAGARCCSFRMIARACRTST
jgi:hypothetical protein